jgi:hypothetical protein
VTGIDVDPDNTLELTFHLSLWPLYATTTVAPADIPTVRGSTGNEATALELASGDDSEVSDNDDELPSVPEA